MLTLVEYLLATCTLTLPKYMPPVTRFGRRFRTEEAFFQCVVNKLLDEEISDWEFAVYCHRRHGDTSSPEAVEAEATLAALRYTRDTGFVHNHPGAPNPCEIIAANYIRPAGIHVPNLLDVQEEKRSFFHSREH